MMNVISARFILLVLAGFGGNFCASAATPKQSPVSFDIAALPVWVKPITADLNAKVDPGEGGFSYLLVDRQDNLEGPAFYYHEIRRIASENGLQNGASITVSFDPSYEKLTFHSISVTRNGTTANRLDRSQINLLQREKDMERFIYDGTYTAQCELEDIRLGDVVEYAYTIVGSNPVKKGKFYTVLATQWRDPVHRCISRLVYPTSRKLNFLAQNRSFRPAITTSGGITEWLLDDTNVRGRAVESDSPSDYEPRGSVQISEFGSWQEVAESGLQLFEVNAAPSTELQAKIDNLRMIGDVERRILTALRFVQHEIRYLAIGSGISSHQPTPPNEVLRRRFGDCKDKTLLLAKLLHETGLETTPALVSSTYRGALGERLPSLGPFDHVILQVRTGEGIHWLDATRANQRGPLSQIYVSRYEWALILKPGTKELTKVRPPPDSLPRKKVVETYRVPAPEGTGDLEVVTEYHGFSADSIRTTFQENTQEEIEKKYLEFYARQFPEIKKRLPLLYEELADANACRVTESYVIPKIWQIDDEKNNYALFLYPAEINSAMGSATSPQRDDPLSLDYPVSVVEKINANMFEEWPLNAKNQNVANEFFRYRDEAKVQKEQLQFSYFYETLTDRVSVADLAKYNIALSKVKDTLGYNLSYSTPQQLKSIRGWRGFNWPIGVCLGGVLAASSYFGYRYFKRSKLPASLSPPLSSERSMSLSVEGIGGWLVLVAIGLVLTLLRILGTSVVVWTSVLNLQVWRSLTEPGGAAYHPYWAPALLFELFFNAVCLVFAVLLLALFFKKRAAWSHCYVVFLIANLIAACLDAYFIQQIPAAAESPQGSVKQVAQAIIAAAIWIPYVLVSKRVKVTFRH
jgi:transglutaminase-like putative cysteine protease